MKNMKLVLVMATVGLMISPAAMGAVITSGSFSFGYGCNSAAGWDTTETSGVNTATTIGDFSFTPTPVGNRLSTTGPTFTNRVLGAGPSSSLLGTAGVSVSIVGSYNGSAPLDAAVVPNYRLTLVIDSVSVYAVNTVTNATLQGGFEETTSGHTSQGPETLFWTAPPTAPHPGQSWGYKQLLMDPADFQVVGTSSTRTFSPYSSTGTLGSIPFADGLEVTGHVELEYDVVPEPATMGLLGLGGLISLLRRRRS